MKRSGYVAKVFTIFNEDVSFEIDLKLAHLRKNKTNCLLCNKLVIRLGIKSTENRLTLKYSSDPLIGLV